MTTKSVYPKYKDSGTDWLQKIPSDWNVFPFKKIFKLSDERVENNPALDLALSVSGYRGVVPRDIDSMEGQMPSEDIGKYRIIRKGQLAVNTMWLNYAGLGVSDYEGYISPAYRAYNIDQTVDKKFAHHLLRSPLYIQKYTSLLYGLRPNSLQVKNDDFERIEILVPPIETQKRIADFLDEKTRIIDELVAKKENLIGLLREKRAAIITQAVTKGLDPKAKMKPSGIDWLGEIPAGWEIIRAKYLGRAIIGLTYSPNEETDEEDGILILRSSNIQNGLIELSDNVYVKKDIPKDLITRIGDILICSRNGSAQLIGKNVLIDAGTAKLSFGAFMTIFRSKYSNFIYYFFNSNLFLSQTGLFSTSTINQLTTATLNNMAVLLPPLGEQKEIVKHLKKELPKIDEILQKVKIQIAQLKEYRSSLIYSAVTGKIKI